jgi:molecular chaperone GrpE
MKDTRAPEPDPQENGTESADEPTIAPGEETGTPVDAAAAGADAADEPADERSPEEVLAEERDALREKWLRTAAELDNVRKRARREVADARRFARADLLRPLLVVADDLERAVGSLSEDGEDTVDGVREGVVLIQQRFLALLKDQGVEPVEAQDAPFDPARHEAVGQMEREDVEPGIVVEIVQQGYRLGDLLLRPARVIISS